MIITTTATNANGVDATIQLNSDDFSTGGGTTEEEKAIAQMALDVDLWRADTSVAAPPSV